MVEDFLELSQHILQLAGKSFQRIDFLKEVSRLIGWFSGCDTVELCVEQYETQYYWRAMLEPEESFSYKLMPRVRCDIGEMLNLIATDPDHPGFCVSLLKKQLDPSLPFVTKNGSLWMGDSENPYAFRESSEKAEGIKLLLGKGYKSVLLIPFEISNENWGVLQMKSRQSYHFTESEVLFYEGISQTLGLTVAYRRMKVECGERVKELTCLYGIAQITSQHDKPLSLLLEQFVELLPPAMQFPKLAMSRISLDGKDYQTANFEDSRYSKSFPLVIRGEERGYLEVAYREEESTFVSDPFLNEEKHLLDTISKEISLVIEDRESIEYKAKLQEQLRHADRLATLGQLAAGIAHELNEPLGSILGFAQLLEQDRLVDGQSREDLEKIIEASMHAREIVRKLVLFSRQAPSNMTQVDINEIVEKGLYFLESRIRKEGIKLTAQLALDMPIIIADQSQIHQVLVNLTVNAIQAMPNGGNLLLETKSDEDYVYLIVQDDGIGMDRETLKKIFLPFFTTKDIGQGTGLGLPVIHGIVVAHGGLIDVESNPGEGSRFTVRLPVIKIS